MTNEHDTFFAWFKISVAWIGLLIGGITLGQIAVVMTIIFTGLQIYKQIRDLRKERRLERLEAKLKQPAP